MSDVNNCDNKNWCANLPLPNYSASEVKPVYRCKVFEDADWIYLEKFPKERESFLIIETLYPAAALEALQAENAKLKECLFQAQNAAIDIANQNAEQAKRIAELELIEHVSRKLVECKGRYHTEQNMIALAKLFDAQKVAE